MIEKSSKVVLLFFRLGNIAFLLQCSTTMVDSTNSGFHLPRYSSMSQHILIGESITNDSHIVYTSKTEV